MRLLRLTTADDVDAGANAIVAAAADAAAAAA
jgi:hypothetical protein